MNWIRVTATRPYVDYHLLSDDERPSARLPSVCSTLDVLYFSRNESSIEAQQETTWGASRPQSLSVVYHKQDWQGGVHRVHDFIDEFETVSHDNSNAMAKLNKMDTTETSILH